MSGDIFVIQRIKKKRKKPTKILYFEFGYGMVKLRAINRKLTEWPGRDVSSDGDVSDRDEIIPAEQKSKLEMNPAGGNNPCGAKEQGGDASGRSK